MRIRTGLRVLICCCCCAGLAACTAAAEGAGRGRDYTVTAISR
jgi:hypothetical protein